MAGAIHPVQQVDDCAAALSMRNGTSKSPCASPGEYCLRRRVACAATARTTRRAMASTMTLRRIGLPCVCLDARYRTDSDETPALRLRGGRRTSLRVHALLLRSSDSTVRSDVLIPYPLPALSVTRHKQISVDKLWRMGKALRMSDRPGLYGRTNLTAKPER